ncbi:MAG TPA: C-terminal binding protein [Opitutaceae bacterium]|nr:C-terminal binding protein [Opitutaceae bacterium]
MPTVLITDYGFPDIATERRIIEGATYQLATAQARTAADVIEAARRVHAEALLVQWAPVTAEVFAALPDLRVVVRYGIGVDNVDLAAAAAHGVTACNVPDYCIDEVADHALALALSLLRRLPQTHARTLAGEWKITPPGHVPAFRDTTFACAGFGRIARAVLHRAAAFGFRCAAHDPYVSDAVITAAGIKPLTRDRLFAEAGVLSLHMPLTPETKHFVGGSSLAAMRPHSIVVNTSRGGLVDTAAVAAALVAGRLGGAGLDVYETEPLASDHPLRQAPNTLLTSHTAWFSAASVPQLQRLAAEEVVRVLRGDPPRNPVRPPSVAR